MTNHGWVPEERHQTIRQAILRHLEQDRLSAAELSRLVSQPEKDIYHHLETLRQSGKIELLPPLCANCDYRFEDRKKTGKPGKCPQCKSTRIKPPLFVIRQRKQ